MLSWLGRVMFRKPPSPEDTSSVVDPSDAKSLGVHLVYISSQVHTLSEQVAAASQQIAALMQTLPATYAPIGTVQRLSAQIDAIESKLDKQEGATPAQIQLAQDVREMRQQYDRMRGALAWTWTLWLMFAVLLSAAIASKGKLW